MPIISKPNFVSDEIEDKQTSNYKSNRLHINERILLFWSSVV